MLNKLYILRFHAIILFRFGTSIICLPFAFFPNMYSPVPNAYFAKYVNKETQQDCSQNTASQPVTGTSVQQEAHQSTECTDEELMSALSQTEEPTDTTVNTSHGDAGRISEDSQTACNLLSDAHRATENRDVSPPGEEEVNLGRSVSGEEGVILVDGEMNVDLSPRFLLFSHQTQLV